MRTDLVLYVRDINSDNQEDFDFGETAKINVYTKCDIADKGRIEEVKKIDENAVFVYEHSEDGLKVLKERMVAELKKQENDDETLLGDIVPANGTVVLVVPIDDAAPKGRLILPQVQTIRDCLDHNIKSVVTNVEMLAETLSELKSVDLVVTDSQAFHQVSEIVPEDIDLTSFSMLLANQKGRINQQIEGTKAIAKLCDGDEILMLESCTHSTTHEDIGKVKIPALLQKKTGKKLNFTHISGYDFPENIEKYNLVIQCGGCMINKRTIQNRLALFEERGIPVTNYGVILAYLNGILDRASKVFVKE